MELLPDQMATADFYKYMIQVITPRAIAWVSTISGDGVPNLAPFSFSTGISSHPPSHLFCPVNRGDGTEKDTLRNVRATKEYVSAVVPYALRDPMNETSDDFPSDVNEFTHAGLTPTPSQRVKPFCVKESPINMECRVLQIVDLAEGPYAGHIVIGQILAVHINDDVIKDGKIDPALLDTIGRLGGPEYARTTDRFSLPRPLLRR